MPLERNVLSSLNTIAFLSYLSSSPKNLHNRVTDLVLDGLEALGSTPGGGGLRMGFQKSRRTTSVSGEGGWAGKETQQLSRKAKSKCEVPEK